jgi:hypothetical protein
MRAGSGIPPARAPGQLTKGEGYGSNRSREGPHTSSSGRWPAERGRRRAGAARLARSKGPPAPRDDDGRGQIANFARPRSRPHGLIPAELRAIDRGIPLRTVTEPTRSGLGLAPVRAAAERKTPPTAGLKFWDERTQRVVELVPPTAMRNLARGFRPSIKRFLAAALPVGTARNRARPAVVSRGSLPLVPRRRPWILSTSASTREGVEFAARRTILLEGQTLPGIPRA